MPKTFGTTTFKVVVFGTIAAVVVCDLGWLKLLLTTLRAIAVEAHLPLAGYVTTREDLFTQKTKSSAWAGLTNTPKPAKTIDIVEMETILNLAMDQASLKEFLLSLRVLDYD